MSRWEPDPRGRLMKAALELYGERGFDQTTVAEIAERAGLTERTFFRHFADKREVLFSGEVHDLLMKTLDDAPPSATPIEAVSAALEAAGSLLEERRELTRRRQAVIAANPALQERAQVKFARLASEMADVLHRRGVDRLAASLTAEIGIAVFRSAFARWIDTDDRDLRGLIEQSLDELKAVATGR